MRIGCAQRRSGRGALLLLGCLLACAWAHARERVAPRRPTAAGGVGYPTAGDAAWRLTGIPAARWVGYQDLAERLFRQYLRIDTTNPPGHEAVAATFWKNVFDHEGIETHLLPFAPGRANLIAILHGDGEARPIILANHMDVVTSVTARWLEPPFSANLRDGAIYARGAEDMKDEGVAQAMALIILHREHVRLKRDVIFLAVGDEEVDDAGAAAILRDHRDLLHNAEYFITEGGEGVRAAATLGGSGLPPAREMEIDVAEKAPYWIHIQTTGEAGHGSRPLPDSAPNRLVRALQRVVAWQTPLRVSPAVEQYFRAVAAEYPEPRRSELEDVRRSLRSADFRAWLTAQPGFNYLVRDTVALTMLQGSRQTNVIPSAAWANLDVRLLPGTPPEQFVEELRQQINDPQVTVTHIGNFRPPNSSPTDSELFAIFRQVTHAFYPQAVVVPKLLSGFTESEMFRRAGMLSYGFCPYVVSEEEANTEHADNERMNVEEFRQGQPVMYSVVRAIAAAGSARAGAAAGALAGAAAEAGE